MQTPAPTYRRNRFFTNLKSQIHAKFPKDLGADELNVLLGLGSKTIAAAGSQTLSTVAPRDLIIRDLVIKAPADGVVTNITIAGDALLIGDFAPTDAFTAQNQNRPTFDLPVAGGTTVSITVSSTAGGQCSASFNID